MNKQVKEERGEKELSHISLSSPCTPLFLSHAAHSSLRVPIIFQADCNRTHDKHIIVIINIIMATHNWKFDFATSEPK
jgi:hypothetical protein